MKRRAHLKRSLPGRNLQRRVAWKRFCFKWEAFQPSSLAGLPAAKRTAIAASGGQNSVQTVFPPLYPCQWHALATAAAVRRKPTLLDVRRSRCHLGSKRVLFLLTFLPYDFIVCCRGLSQGLRWVTSSMSDFLLCVIRLYQTLNCHWQIRGGGTRGGDKRLS